jgi:ornithine cyclodeaminase/alanine dehydrogenase-like protein (mu-crystallin family)
LSHLYPEDAEPLTAPDARARMVTTFEAAVRGADVVWLCTTGAELNWLDPALGTELGEVLLDQKRGRNDARELTVYKAMGHAAEDLAAPTLVFRRERQVGAGQTITL